MKSSNKESEPEKEAFYEFLPEADAYEMVSSGNGPSFLPESTFHAWLKTDGKIVEAGKGFCEQFQLDENGKGENILDFFSSGDRALLARKLLLAAHNKSGYRAVVTPLHATEKQPVKLEIGCQDGKLFIRFPLKETYRRKSVGQETSIQKKAEVVSKRIPAKKGSPFLESVPLPAILCNENYQIKEVNQRFLKLTGYQSLDEIQQFSAVNLFPDEKGELARLWKGLEEDKEAVCQLRMLTSGGEEKWVQLSISFAEAESPAFLVVLHDISDLKRQENLLLQKQEDMDMFMDRAFHDLKGPINSLLALYQLVEHEFGRDKKVMQYLHHYHQGISRLHRIVQDLLVLSRIQKAETRYKKVNLKRMVEECLQSFRNFDHFYDIRFVKIIQVPDHILMEESLLQTIVQNLLENAIKYCSSYKPEVRIEAAIGGGFLRLEVSDNGIGIAEELQKRVFERFFRATNKASGSGLGLYLLKQAVLKLNGSVKLQSEEGKGATFIVYLPVGEPVIHSKS